ncbi:hypothetical protein AAIB41_03535 [Brucella sp. BE17]|uniref:hypothetical protein n=1 Tax=Brucella sp. BE17 TaxID=3142977 RepID=UPI0031BAB43A
MQNNFAIVTDDLGQLAFREASEDNRNYAFRIRWASGEVDAFVGLPMTTQRQGGQANTVDLMQGTIEVNSNVVRLSG